MQAFRKRLLVGLAMALVLLSAVGLWVLSRGSAEGEEDGPGVRAVATGSRPATPPATLSRPASGPAAPMEGPHLDLDLVVNVGVYPEVVQGTPLLLTVTLCHLDAEEAESLRIRSEAVADGRLPVPPDLLDELRAEWQERLASLPAAPVKLTAVGQGLAGWLRLEVRPGEEWSEAPWALEPLGPAPAGETEVGAQRVRWELAVSPKDAAAISPGELTIRACLKGRMEPKVPQTLVSAPRTVRVVAKDGASPETALASIHLTGLYHLGRRDFAAAERFAREALALAPKRVKSWTLLGEAKEGQGDPEAALEAYSQAIDLIAESGSKEPPPRFLMERRRALLWGRAAASQPSAGVP